MMTLLIITFRLYKILELQDDECYIRPGGLCGHCGLGVSIFIMVRDQNLVGIYICDRYWSVGNVNRNANQFGR